ncbi:Hippocampus abundant transcript-like protein 2 [Bienertia sinuspersici]
MSSPYLMEVVSNAMCPGESYCPDALYLNRLQQTVAGLLMIPVLPFLCELSDEYGRKPLLLLTMSTSIFPVDVVEDDKRVAAFSWDNRCNVCFTCLGEFASETARRAPMTKQSLLSILFKPIRERYNSIRYAATIIFTKPSLRGIYLVSFLYEFGMSGFNSVLLYYLKDGLNLNESKFSETLMIVKIGSVFSQMLIVPVINALTGEKAMLSMGLLASVTYAFFYSMAWATWLPYISVSLGLAYGFVKPSVNMCYYLKSIKFK